MRCWILSDLHREVGTPWNPVAIPRADVAVVAGDVGQGLVDTIGWLSATIRPHMRVVLVAGNHEFYRRAFLEELPLGREAARLQGVDFLEDGTVDIDGVAFFGCTLWTDYRADGDELMRSSMEDARRGMNDHRLIAWTRKPEWKRFRPEEAYGLHRASTAFLARALSDPSAATHAARAKVVVTHHAPSMRSIAPAFEGKSLNPCYVSRLEGLIETCRPNLWVHGHTHTSFDYRIGDTRVVCNPKGYGTENRAFDPGLVVEIPS
ncbi:metallophosphoesterase [Methylobacterium sp. Leaf117]|uniref:metallophosphoesterase n=1 Tax=Methylobacterium sp. Leaf117 TaxID=1736260 RepID=UPI0006F729E8|nr:metallophosphoesterase [Methylobacterium sp. Leaf117]KQP80313.1 metallophosphoesterase [Methylobacterium sp. Leaf117]